MRRIVLRNVSSRRVDVGCRRCDRGDRGLGHRSARACGSSPVPARPLTARVAFLPRRVGAIQGWARLRFRRRSRHRSVGGGAPVPRARLIGGVGMSPRSFRASDRAPAVLTVQAGQVRDLAGRRQLRPVSRLDVELWRGGERLGLVARLRDVLPGRYAFGVTGRGPRGGALAKGPYRLRVLAVPPDGPAEAETVRFRIR